MASYLITGASRGIGLGLCTTLAARPASEVSVVFAAARTVTDALKELASGSNGRVEIVPVDVTKEEDVKKAVAQVEQSLKGKGLDFLFNNAGVMNWTFEGIQHMDDLDSSFKTNVTSVQYVTSGFLPLLQKGNLKQVFNMSTTFGSINMAKKFIQAPAPAYKITKAALNMLTVQYALSFAEEGFTFAAISPGWVKTDLGGGDRADIDVDTSVTAIMKIVDGATKEDNGKFLNIHVKGWENHPGLNQYPGGESPW